MDREQKNTLVEQWYRQCAKLLFHVACLLGVPDAAEEIVQETFRIVMETDKLDQIEFPKAWLRKIALNVVRNRQRDCAKYVSVPLDENQNPMYNIGSCEDEPDIMLTYGGIVSNGDLRLLRLSLVDGYTSTEIAQELGISAKACQKRAERAKEKAEGWKLRMFPTFNLFFFFQIRRKPGGENSFS